VDFAGVFEVLKSAGYDGWISLEAGGDGKEDIRLAIEYIRKVWNEV
jgi:sugar phosphate isomerase/epimerase